tara:strand:- start:27553 stop:27843 length:291 start_codon:yes stop_codon:yes gene_type:complete
MGWGTNLLIVGALIGGYQLRGCIDQPDPITTEKQIEKICDTNICDIVGEKDPNKFNYNRFKHHGNGLIKEIDNYGNKIKPDWFSEYIDKPILKYFK